MNQLYKKIIKSSLRSMEKANSNVKTIFVETKSTVKVVFIKTLYIKQQRKNMFLIDLFAQSINVTLLYEYFYILLKNLSKYYHLQIKIM